VRSIPRVYAVQINDPGDDCTPDNNWHFNTDCVDGVPTNIQYNGLYPVIVYHIDWLLTPECEQACNDQNWNWSPYDGSPCQICYDDDPNNPGFPVAYNGTMYRQASYEQVPVEDITVTWDWTGETVGVRNLERETYWYKSWNTGDNYMTSGNSGPVTEPYATAYMNPFSDLAPAGPQSYTVVANGQVFNFTQEIFSDRVMPTVASTTEGLTFQKVKPNGKVKTKTKDITVVNITAREMINEVGETVLVVQWTVPDEALALVPMSNLRLRMYVGNGWFTDPGQVDVDFCWMDVALHTSSMVVPAEMYEWIKTTTLAKGINELDIAGMYREQYNGYHNRGYFEGVTFGLTQ